MFHELCSGSPSSVAWRTHPGWHTWVTWKGPPSRGELVSSFSSEHPPEHQIVHLDLSAAHESLLVAFECLMVLCIFNRRLTSSFIDEVDILVSELILRDFVVCLDM
jgi:hypothetical protein